MDYSTINLRYSQLAKTECCLSCGGAINFANVKPGEICIDISDGMLETARANAFKFGVTNVKFIRSELEKLELPNETADLVVSNCTINHATDKTAVWSEIYRILKNGGRFVVSDIYATSPVPKEYSNDPVAVSECWAGSVTREEYLATLVATGFRFINILEESLPYNKGKVEVSSFTITGEKHKV